MKGPPPDSPSWGLLRQATQEDRTVSGVAAAVEDGGLILLLASEVQGLDEVPAFLPMSQIESVLPTDMRQYLGQTMDVRIIKLDSESGRCVVSRRVLLEEAEHVEAEARRRVQARAALGALSAGMVVEGLVINVVSYGAFIRIGCVDGLLHASDMSLQPGQPPSSVLRVGERAQLRVRTVEPAERRLWLALVDG